MPTSDLYSVKRFDRRTRRVLDVCASGLTRDDARALAASLRASDDAHGYQMAAAPLVEQAAALTPSVLPARSTAARLAGVARSYSMGEAHALARKGSLALAGVPYAVQLAAALKTAARRPRRCALASLRKQAAEFVRVCAETGARFDYVQKACDALRFSAECDTRTLVVPSKLVGVKSFQDAAAALASRLNARGGWVVSETDGATVYGLGLRLGDLQPKHARWIAALGGVRVAVVAVTGGHPVVNKAGEAVRTLRGVNVALEVGSALALRVQQREYAEHVEAIRSGRLVEVGPGVFVPPAKAEHYADAVRREGGHARAWGRLD